MITRRKAKNYMLQKVKRITNTKLRRQGGKKTVAGMA